jgi:hypothetical protein
MGIFVRRQRRTTLKLHFKLLVSSFLIFFKQIKMKEIIFQYNTQRIDSEMKKECKCWIECYSLKLSELCPVVQFQSFLYTLKIRGCVHKSPDCPLERELQMVQLSAPRCSCIAILWVSLVIFAAMIPCVASKQVFIVVVYFVIDSVRQLLDTPPYNTSVGF